MIYSNAIKTKISQINEIVKTINCSEEQKKELFNKMALAVNSGESVEKIFSLYSEEEKKPEVQNSLVPSQVTEEKMKELFLRFKPEILNRDNTGFEFKHASKEVGYVGEVRITEKSVKITFNLDIKFGNKTPEEYSVMLEEILAKIE